MFAEKVIKQFRGKIDDRPGPGTYHGLNKYEKAHRPSSGFVSRYHPGDRLTLSPLRVLNSGDLIFGRSFCRAPRIHSNFTASRSSTASSTPRRKPPVPQLPTKESSIRLPLKTRNVYSRSKSVAPLGLRKPRLTFQEVLQKLEAVEDIRDQLQQNLDILTEGARFDPAFIGNLHTLVRKHLENEYTVDGYHGDRLVEVVNRAMEHYEPTIRFIQSI
jgi:hypothetical protein